jgi:protein TonB
MKFWQCLLIATGIHIAIMGIPTQHTHISGTRQVVALVITDKAKSAPMNLPVILKKPPTPKPEIKKPKPVVRKNKKPKTRKKQPTIGKNLIKDRVEPEKVVISEPEEPVDPVEEVPEVAVTVGTAAVTESTSEPEVFQVQFGSAEGPQFIRRVAPRYPTRAKRLHRQGIVLLLLTIDENGTLINVEIVNKAGFGFDEAAVTAVRESAFCAARKNGRSVPCRALLPIKFQLR